MKINGAVFKSTAPNLKAARRRSVRPRMFPLGGLRIEGAETEALDDRSLIGSLEEFQGNAAIQNLACRQQARALAPGSIGQRKTPDVVPLPFQESKLLFFPVRH